MKSGIRFAVLLLTFLMLLPLCGCSSEPDPAATAINSLDDLAGKKIGIVTGATFDDVVGKYVRDPQLVYNNSHADNALALDYGKVDAYMTDEPVMRVLLDEHPNQRFLAKLEDDYYAFFFTKTDEGKALRDQFNVFLAECKEDGTLDEIDKIWFGNDDSLKKVDLDSLTGENGTLHFATESGEPPFTYIQDGKIAGFEIDLAARFCRKYGYGLEITDLTFDGVLASISVGKSDFGASCISITEERKENMYFSEPDYVGGVVMIVSDAKSTGTSSGSILESFEKTFIREGRWKMFLSGIGITLLITISSAILGTVLGFLLYLVYYKKNRIFNGIVNVIVDILEKTPIVVIMMILYYIIFGKSELDGIWVSIIGFSFLFAFGVVQTIDGGVQAIDIGQTEASLALGFSDIKAFMQIILPQASKHFLPSYRSSIVSLLKDTAIVGYIAVQDLTKVGDIVRSRTYEAFFPLIATAAIYFLLAWILTLIVRRIEFNFDSKKRSEESILKGVQKK